MAQQLLRLNYLGSLGDKRDFQQERYRRVGAGLEKRKVSPVPEQLAFYDYIGNNPEKRWIVQSGLNGDSILLLVKKEIAYYIL